MFAGESDKLQDINKMKMDSLVDLKNIKDSIKNLNDAEKKILETGTLRINIEPDKDLLSFKFSFPFSGPGDINGIKDLLTKARQGIMDNVMKKVSSLSNADKEKAGLFDKDISEQDKGGLGGSISDYYITDYKKGKMTCKVDTEKLKLAENEKAFTSLKEMSQMGMGSTIKTIINLPRPAKKATGKSVPLSPDKKKVTIEGSLDDFFENASHFEYEIEY